MSHFEEMKRYVRFGPEEARLVAALADVATPVLPTIVDELYDRVREHEDAHGVLTGEAQIARLKGAMLRWLTRLCGGTYNEDHFAEAVQIGRVHARIGLAQRYTFTAMALLRVALTRIADREMGAEAPHAREALSTLLDLELGAMLEGYHEAFLARIAHTERLERAKLDRPTAQVVQRYESAVDLASVMIIGLDRRGRIQLFNREAERVTGWGRDEAMGQVFVDWMSPADAGEEDRAAMAHALATVDERSVAFDGFVSSRSRHVRRVRWHVTSAPAVATDEVVRFVFGQDTTDAAALAEKTRQHERLAAVGTLAAGLAHEIRNPLNGAQLHVSYLKRSIERSDANRDLLEAVTVIGDEIRRLAALATEFLEFARPSPLAKIELSVRSLFERSLQVATPQAVAQKIVLRSDLPSQDLALHGDPARLEQALVNLLQNAIEATADGRGSSVTLRARRQPRRVIVEVEDDGPGIAVPDSPIFDAFFTTKPAGTGLGLAITHRIVTDHAGTIDVESRPGRTVFRVGLPVDGLGGRAVEAGGTGDL